MNKIHIQEFQYKHSTGGFITKKLSPLRGRTFYIPSIITLRGFLLTLQCVEKI